MAASSSNNFEFLGTMAGNQAFLPSSLGAAGVVTYGREYVPFGGSDDCRQRFQIAFCNSFRERSESCKGVGEAYSFTPVSKRDGMGFGSELTFSQGGAFFLSKKLEGEKKYYSSSEYTIDQLASALSSFSGISPRKLLEERIVSLVHRYFDPVTEPQEGDIVLYISKDSPYNVSHTGIYRNSKPNWNSPAGGTVESQWGDGFVFQHDFFLVPSSFGDQALFFRVKREMEGASSSMPPYLDPSICSFPSLFALDRAIDALYGALPWPEAFPRIGLSTDVVKGYGDLSAAAKAMRAIETCFPEVNFRWIVKGYLNDTGEESPLVRVARQFFPDEGKVEIAKWPESLIADFAIVGPVPTKEVRSDLSSLRVPIGRYFGFVENGYSTVAKLPLSLRSQLMESRGDFEKQSILFSQVFPYYFFLQGRSPSCLSMGLQAGSGIFFPRELSTAPLSLEYCCPSYLDQIQEEKLKQEILSAMGGGFNYFTHSFNSGYAWDKNKKIAFVEIVAMHLATHEPEKNAVIVLNQSDKGIPQPIEPFCESLCFRGGIDFYRELGFGRVEVIGEEKRQLLSDGVGKTLTVILRNFIQPADMQKIQLASERILATGDNTAAEAFAARCKLYLYERLKHKHKFLTQQISLAETISPELADLLKSFSDLSSIRFDSREMEVVRRVLKSPTLGQETLAFCHKVIQDYSFEPILKNALLRAAYRSLFPDLERIERESFDRETIGSLLSHAPDSATRPIRISLLPEMQEKIIHHIISGGSHGQQ